MSLIWTPPPRKIWTPSRQQQRGFFALPAGMGAAKPSGGGGGANDPYYSNVLLLLHGNGADGSTSFPDSGPSARTVSRFGDTQVDTAFYQYGGASILFDGSGDYLTVPSSSDWDFSSGDVTVELWIRPTGSSIVCILDSRNPSTGVGWQLYLFNDNMLLVQGDSGSLASAASAVTRSVWTHIAWTRASGTHRLFVAGTQVATNNTMTISSFTDALYIGRTLNAFYQYAGHMDDIRITKGVARYTASFTPPAAEFPNS